jgi:hypothetical protein
MEFFNGNFRRIMIKFNNFYNNNLIQPPPPPQPLLRQYQQPQQQYRRANPELMIQNVTSAKILQEQKKARSPAGIHIHPDHLIRSITEWKITQYRASARLKAEKEQAERIKRAKRTIAPMDLSGLQEDSMVKLADLMAVCLLDWMNEYHRVITKNIRRCRHRMGRNIATVN